MFKNKKIKAVCWDKQLQEKLENVVDLEESYN